MSPKKQPITAIIFDMDGLLIDSEPFWQQAEQEIFQQVGLTLTQQDCERTKGLRIDEVVSFWYQQQTATTRVADTTATTTISQLSQNIIQRVSDLVSRYGVLRPGVREALDFFVSKGFPLALASSSSLYLIETTLRTLDIGHLFSVVCSAETEPYGKPHPAIYLTTAQKLRVEPRHCLALEDSLNGVIAAKAARMRCIAIPEAHERQDPRFSLADRVLHTGAEVTEALWSSLHESN